MKTIQHTQTLFYYDGPQVFEARDGIGGHYVAVMVEPLNETDRYLVTGVAPENLREFRSGRLDLRSMILEGEDEGWFLAEVEEGLESPLKLLPQSASLLDSGFLPEPGFLLHTIPSTELALQEARIRNNLVLEITVEPPEAAQDHRIRVETLAGLLVHIQTLVKHAYGAALRELSLQTRRAIDRSDAHLLDVVIPAAPGSFRVFLEAAKHPDMFGQSELERALGRVDALFANASNPPAALAAIKANRGHLAGAYLRLLRFLVQHRTGLRYSWAQPTLSKPNSGGVSEAEAGPLLDAFSGISNLASESVELTGALEKADVVNGGWRLLTAEGSFSGKIKEGGPSLEGLILGASYKFSCVEEIEEVDGTGREQRTLFLIERESM
ncbi:MAG: hypothetical protein NTZ94_01670 [Verrucomicrobia bacterium]|nr:hypothetical protein [Verrucomicrobiota bacterium]